MNKDELEKSLQRVHSWIHSADQKNSIFLALIFGSLAIGGSEFIPFFISRIEFSHPYSATLASAVVVVFLWSVLKSILVLKPSLSNDNKSVTYFGHIAQMSLKDFRKKMIQTKSKQYIDELTEQIHIGSHIARKKHKKLSEAITIFLCFILILVIFIGLSYVIS